MGEHRVARLEELRPGAVAPREVDGTRLVLVRLGEGVFALDGVCAHRGGPLGEGRLTGARLACPWHGWIYDVRTGQCAFPPRGQAVARYPVRLDGDNVWVELPDAAGAR